MKSLIAMSCVFGSISLVAFVYSAGIPSQIAPSPQPVRSGVHLLEPEQNLGIVGLNETRSGSFTVVNDTDQPITLGEPLKSCSCANAVLDRRELAPGEQCSLTFTIQTGSRRVPRVETIALLFTTAGSADPKQLLARVYFIPKGVFEVEPADVVLTRAVPKATFTVRANPAAERREVLDVRSNHRCVKVDTRALPVVTLELDLETPDEAFLNTECVIYTNNPAEDMIRVPVRVRKE